MAKVPFVIGVALTWLVAAAVPALAGHNRDQHSDNMSLLSNYSEGGEYGLGSDLAFWGSTMVAGSFEGPGGFRLLDISQPSALRRVGLFECPGTQADVSIWRDIAIVSVDQPRGAGPDADGIERKADECGAPIATQPQIQSGAAWEGLRIVSIADPAKPVQLVGLKTDCGSHTHTIVPDEARGRLIVYVLSYPLNPQSPGCNPGTHRKISVVEVPIAAPQNAKVLGTPSVAPAVGCHDVTIFVPRKLAAAACISESQIWDVSDPANPKVLSHIYNPRINIHHSTAFAWDGEKLVLGDELGGAAASPGCVGPEQTNLGGLWFYDVKDPASPRQVGQYRLPQTVATALCTAHLFNPVPLRSDKDILVSSWYNGATTVLDFTDPANPRQLAYYMPTEPVAAGAASSPANAWSSYWYNGQVYSNNYSGASPRGIDVFSVKLPELADEIRLERLNPQVQEPLPPPVATTGGGTVTQLPRRCASRRRFIIRLRAPRGDRLVSAVVFVNGRRVKVVKGRRLRAPVDLRGLPKGRVRVDITVRTRRGRRIHATRNYQTCVPKRVSGRRPPV